MATNTPTRYKYKRTQKRFILYSFNFGYSKFPDSVATNTPTRYKYKRTQKRFILYSFNFGYTQLSSQTAFIYYYRFTGVNKHDLSRF